MKLPSAEHQSDNGGPTPVSSKGERTEDARGRLDRKLAEGPADGRLHIMEEQAPMIAGIDVRVSRVFKSIVPDRIICRIKMMPGGCWEYPTSVMANGTRRYATPYFDGRNRALHRIAWESINGPIPNGLEIRHVTCDNPPCCNPMHLASGTHAQNMADRNAKNRQSRFPGMANGRAKLSEEDVIHIRYRYASGGVLQRELAAEHGVGVSIIGHIVTGLAWAQAGGPLTIKSRKRR